MKCPSITEILSLHLQTDSSKSHSELKAWMVAEGHLVELKRKIMGFLREHSFVLIAVSKNSGIAYHRIQVLKYTYPHI